MENLLLLFGVLGAVIAYFVFDDNEWVGIGFFSGAIFFMLTAFILGIVFTPVMPCEYKQISNQRIHSLKDNINSGGSFILGSGSILGELKYYYIKKTDLGFQVKSIANNGNTYIRETDNKKPQIVNLKSKFKNKFLKNIAINLKNDRTIIYVPENTLVENYNVDLE